MTNEIMRRPVNAMRKVNEGRGHFIPHLSRHAVWELAEKAGTLGQIRNGKKLQTHRGVRDSLLIKVIFDTCCRVSEVVGDKNNGMTGFRFCDLKQDNIGNTSVSIMGKGGKQAEVAMSNSIYSELMSYIFFAKLNQIPNWEEERIFAISRKRVFQIVQRAFSESPHINKPDRVGAVHVLRHSGAITRLSHHGNPKALQDHLRHASIEMTINYMKTLSEKESLLINQNYDVNDSSVSKDEATF